MNLTLDVVSFSYGNTAVLQNVTLEVPRGDFLTVLGPNGSGKSTLFRLIDRILLPSAGTIKLDGRPLASYSRRDLARNIGYVPQETNWIFPFTVLEAVLMGRSPSIGALGFERDEDVDIATKAMELMDINHLRAKTVNALSGGERQRVLVARALAQKPRILLLDEPNAHLDLAHQLEMFQLLRLLNTEQGITILCVSHDLNLAAAFGRRVLLLGQPPGTSGYTVHSLGVPEEVLTEHSIAEVFRTDVTVDRSPAAPHLRITVDVTRNRHPRNSL